MRCRRRAAAIRNGLAPGEQVQRSAHRLRQQDGPRRRELRDVDREHAQEARRECLADSDSAGQGRSAQRSARRRQPEGDHLSRRRLRWVRPTKCATLPDEHKDAVDKAYAIWSKQISNIDDEIAEAVLEEKPSHARDAEGGHSPADDREQICPGRRWLRLQEQGRAVPGRRGHRLSPESARHSAGGRA